jgi:hypothetical protein
VDLDRLREGGAGDGAVGLERGDGGHGWETWFVGDVIDGVWTRFFRH